MPMANVFDQLRKMGLIQKVVDKDELTNEGIRREASTFQVRSMGRGSPGRKKLSRSSHPFFLAQFHL